MSIVPKLEVVTIYHIRFVVKLLWKCCECNSTLIFVESKLLLLLNQDDQNKLV